MSDRPWAERESQEPLQVGATQRSAQLDSEQARDIVRLRLEQLVGGALLTEAGIARLSQRLVARHYDAGELIIKQGVRGDFMGVVVSGQVVVYSPRDDSPRAPDQDKPSVLLFPGSTFGEAMLIDGRPSGSLLRAGADTQVYTLRRADFLAEAGRPSPRSARRAGPSLRWLRVVAVALLIAAIAIAAYFGARFLLGQGQEGEQVAAPDELALTSEALQIVAPLDGEVLSRSASLPVRAAFSEPGFYQASLQVDGQVLDVQLNPDPETVPWMADLSWDEAGEGTHVLAIQAYDAERESKMSAPVTVTVVPTGTLAFASNRDGPHAIYAMGTDGRRVTRLTAGPGDVRQPAWGRDGVLAYVAEPEIGQAVIRQMVAGGVAETDLLVGRDPAWSPDGTRLAFAATPEDVSQVLMVSMGELSQVVTDTIDGGNPMQVTAEAAYAGQPSWSPDGTHLAFVAQQEGNWDIWVVALDGSKPRRLTKDPAMDWAPAWSPDGQGLAFVSNRGGSHQIHFMRTDGRGVRVLTDFDHGAESPAWSPDGYWLAFVAYTGSGAGVDAREIYLMRSDGSGQVRLTYNAFDDTQPDWRRDP
jgi:dipeptidyl aminopeptidase/acylaminoacyl peptidase